MKPLLWVFREEGELGALRELRRRMFEAGPSINHEIWEQGGGVDESEVVDSLLGSG
jgi:hypothetical protein